MRSRTLVIGLVTVVVLAMTAYTMRAEGGGRLKRLIGSIHGHVAGH